MTSYQSSFSALADDHSDQDQPLQFNCPLNSSSTDLLAGNWLAELSTEGAGITVADNAYYVINQVANVASTNSVAGIVTALANTGVLDAVDITQAAGNVAALVITAIDSPNTTFVYGFADDGVNAAVQEAGLTLLGTYTTVASALAGAAPFLTTSFI